MEEEVIRKAAIRNKGGSGPLSLDANGWPRMLASSNFGTFRSGLHKAFANLVKNCVLILLK